MGDEVRTIEIWKEYFKNILSPTLYHNDKKKKGERRIGRNNQRGG